jgi:hypothetical protein
MSLFIPFVSFFFSVLGFKVVDSYREEAKDDKRAFVERLIEEEKAAARNKQRLD